MPKPTTPVVQGNSALDGGSFLPTIQNENKYIGGMFKRVIAYVNGLAASSANSGSGEIAPPPPLAGLQVATGGEQVHVAINHPGAVQRGLQYFTEIGVNDPSFGKPLVVDHGASRTSHPFVLPTKDSGGNMITYYLRSYAQYHGSKRSEYAYWGTQGSPTGVQLSGTTQMTPLASKGSGTASNDGSQGGQGLGDSLYRAAPQPKRSVGT